jgi:hypothetical protein
MIYRALSLLAALVLVLASFAPAFAFGGGGGHRGGGGSNSSSGTFSQSGSDGGTTMVVSGASLTDGGSTVHLIHNPEPTTLLLIGSGLVGLGASAYRRRRRK